MNNKTIGLENPFLLKPKVCIYSSQCGEALCEGIFVRESHNLAMECTRKMQGQLFDTFALNLTGKKSGSIEMISIRAQKINFRILWILGL